MALCLNVHAHKQVVHVYVMTRAILQVADELHDCLVDLLCLPIVFVEEGLPCMLQTVPGLPHGLSPELDQLVGLLVQSQAPILAGSGHGDSCLFDGQISPWVIHSSALGLDDLHQNANFPDVELFHLPSLPVLVQVVHLKMEF